MSGGRNGPVVIEFVPGRHGIGGMGVSLPEMMA